MTVIHRSVARPEPRCGADSVDHVSSGPRDRVRNRQTLCETGGDPGCERTPCAMRIGTFDSGRLEALRSVGTEEQIANPVAGKVAPLEQDMPRAERHEVVPCGNHICDSSDRASYQ